MVELQGVVGFRDVGGIPAERGMIRTGRLFRSGHLAATDADGAALLRDAVAHIVDLRSDEEAQADATAVAGIRITRLPLYLGSTRSFFEQDFSLGEIYAHLLAESSAQLVDAVRVIAAGEPTLVHCTAGKGRTGVVIALALARLGAERTAVLTDYARPADRIPEGHRRAPSERLARTYPQSRHAWMLATESPAEVMAQTLTELDARWGSASAYLRAHGLTDDELAALGAALVEPIPASAPVTTRGAHA